MMKLTVRNLSAPQIEAFEALFPKLRAAGLVQRKGTTALVISLHPQVFRRPDRQVTAGTQLSGASLVLWARNSSEAMMVKQQTVTALARKLNGAVAEADA